MYTQLFLSLLLLSQAIAAPAISKRASSIPYGVQISACTTPGVVALTFDDGPYLYTSELLDILSESGSTVTFFLNGQNVANINDHADVVQRMVAEGHQVGSHTWSHADLATLDSAGVTKQMTDLEASFLTILGKIPQYMRPPYLSVNENALATLKSLGYHVIQTSIDTKDYENNTPATIGNAVNNFSAGLDAGGTITLAHDIHETTVNTLAAEMVRILQERGLRSVTVGECLGDDAANWYRAAR